MSLQIEGTRATAVEQPSGSSGGGARLRQDIHQEDGGACEGCNCYAQDLESLRKL